MPGLNGIYINNIMWILNLITFLNLFVVFCILFFKKNNALPNKILALLLINPGINFLSNVFVLNGYLPTFPYLYFFAQITCFGFAPLVHLYIIVLIGKKIRKMHPLYLISTAAMGLTLYYTLEFIVMAPAEKAQYLYGLQNEPYPMQMQIVNGVFILLQQIYFTVAAIEVYTYRKRISNELSSFEKTRVGYVTWFIVLIWILNLITITLYITLPTIQVEYVGLPLVLTTIYSFILYFAFHFNSIFTFSSYQDFVKSNHSLEIPVSVDPVVLPEANEELKRIAQSLELYLSEKEPFKNPNLDLAMLSEQMGVSAPKLSIAINKVLGKNFYDLINELRVKKSMVLLQEMSHLTIEGIAYESGFNSRASFYRAFKKVTDSTPSEFLTNA